MAKSSTRSILARVTFADLYFAHSGRSWCQSVSATALRISPTLE
jgi:hypothetical protein